MIPTRTRELYRGYWIEAGSPDPHAGWEFWHDAYDGAPDYSDGPVRDHRCGSGVSAEDCRSQINEQILDFELDSEGSY